MYRKKRKKQSFIKSPLASQNRWAIRGRNLAYFLSSFLYIIATFFLEAIIYLVLKIWAIIVWLWNLHNRKIGKSQPTIKGIEGKEEPILSQAFLPVSAKRCITFQQVAGLDFVKEQIIQRMVLPFSEPEKAQALRIPQGGGILLFGPPGTGKTLLAKAVAGEIGAVFFHVKPGDLVRKGINESLERLNELFSALQKQRLAVLFLDEADDLVPINSGSVIVDQIGSQFQRELDGFESAEDGHTLLLILATNEPWNISKAMCRPGRCDVRVYVGLPDLLARTKILEMELQNRLVSPDVSPFDWAQKLVGYSGADLAGFVNRSAQNAFIKSSDTEPISNIDLELAFTQIKPSVASSDITRFEKYCQTYRIPME